MSEQQRRRSVSSGEDGPPIKDRLYTAFYRLRYGWQYRSSVEIVKDTPIWILGSCYHADISKGEPPPRDIEGVAPHIRAFIDHYHSVCWMTYRTNFTPIPGTQITTDCGWGCMVRSGQMIMATSLHRHLLGKQWRYASSSPQDLRVHKQILSWFADDVGEQCPFSLHSLMRVAVKQGYKAGDWFGPSQVAVLLRECCSEGKPLHPSLEKVEVYVAHDCTVYVSDVKKIFEDHPGTALLLLVPVRLGSEALNPIYIPCVQSLVTLDHCVGIIGGKPKHSVYFVGFQDEKLIHLDPHYCQSATHMPEGANPYDIETKTYHCHTPRKIPAAKMDPSCTIGFYCTNYDDFTELRQAAEKVLAPPLQKGIYPFFTFTDMSFEEVVDYPIDMQLTSLGGMSTMSVSQGPPTHGRSWRRSSRGLSEDNLVISDEDDFVVVDTRTPLPSDT